MAGGNRSGKTEALCAELAATALGYRPWVLREAGLPVPEKPWERPADLPEEALVYDGAGIRIAVPSVILAVTGQAAKKGIGDVFIPKLEKLLGGIITGRRMGHAGVPSDLLLKNGTRVTFASGEQDVSTFESTNFAAYFIDEPIPRAIYVPIQRGAIDQFARLTFSFTPIGPNSSWLFRELYSKADGKKISVTNVSIFQNPYLNPEAVAQFAEDPAISEIEKEARLYGRFQHLIDRIYPTFDDKVHIVKPFKPPESWYHGLCVDPHAVRPWFMAWFAIDPRGEIYFYREWPKGDFTKIRRDVKSYDDYAGLIRQIEADRPSMLRLIDPNFGPRRDVSKLSGLQDDSITTYFARYGLQFEHRLNDNLEFGEGQVRRLLTYNTKEPLSAINRPRLYFTEDCPNLIASMTFYCAKTKPNSDGVVEEGGREEQYKDGADVVRYVAVSGVSSHALSETHDALAAFENSSSDASSYLD